jgi:hypothetical protein
MSMFDKLTRLSMMFVREPILCGASWSRFIKQKVAAGDMAKPEDFRTWLPAAGEPSRWSKLEKNIRVIDLVRCIAAWAAKWPASSRIKWRSADPASGC